jgi:hypothetical protein
MSWAHSPRMGGSLVTLSFDLGEQHAKREVQIGFHLEGYIMLYLTPSKTRLVLTTSLFRSRCPVASTISARKPETRQQNCTCRFRRR